MLILPTPTVELVLADGEKFDREDAVVESALGQLFQLFPDNVEPADVLLKVVVLNRLYNTSILAVQAVADHIAHLGIDPLLKAGSPQAVDLIAQVEIAGESKMFFSFATKYCNWHNPTAYPFLTPMSMSACGSTKNKTASQITAMTISIRERLQVAEKSSSAS